MAQKALNSCLPSLLSVLFSLTTFKNMELQDIQGLIIRAHANLPEASYLMLQIADVSQVRNWLKTAWTDINNAGSKPTDSRMQIAFSFSGLEKLGAADFVKHGFSLEYVQGMTTEHKQRVLGDLGESAPDKWEWGGPQNDSIDIVLMLFAQDKTQLTDKIQTLETGYAAGGLKEIHRLHTQGNSLKREHFGFRDGIAQPILPGLSKTGSPENTIPVGEIILGYKNGYEQFPESPVIEASLDTEDILPESPTFRGMKDFGKNGSYMVFRQLIQDVPGFWESVFSSVKNENPDADVEEATFLAAKMVGRWPNGKPITLSRETEKPYDEQKDEDFLYAEKDAEGHGCPFGSHIRRANPRDAMPDNKPEKGLDISNLHRILRRGRNFGPPLAETFSPADLIKANPDGQQRGLQFICFNANIQRQFEFIQHSWSNNTKFAGLYSDPDPILGIKDSRNKSETHDFTIQDPMLRRKVKGLGRHVHVLGGAYFFMPGIKALQFLASYSPEQS